MSRSLPLPMHNDPHPGFFNLHRSTQPVDKRRRVAFVLSYSRDWLVTLIFAGLSFLLNKVDPFKRDFFLDDTSIQFPFATHERVSDAMLFVLALVVPLVLMALVNLVSIRSWWDIHTSSLGVIFALAMTASVTNVVKVTTGRPRPDCIDRCQPLVGPGRPASGAMNATICTQSDHTILWDGFRSFPSGHSSLSFAGLGFLSLYLAGKLHIHDRRGHTAKVWICAIPLVAAALIAISRTMDYRHHWHDVLAGALLGSVLAWLAYRQYYPSLWDPLCHRPYSPRIARVRAAVSALVRDGEHLVHPAQEEDLNSSRDSDHATEVNNIELHGSQHVKQMNHADDPSPSLVEVWKQGKGEEILPPGEAPSQSSRQGDHQV